jgi:hypothetical protein
MDTLLLSTRRATASDFGRNILGPTLRARPSATGGRARALTTDAAVVEPLSLSVQTYATQLRALMVAIQTFDDRIAQVFAVHADHDVLPVFLAPATSRRRGWPPRLGPTGPDGTPPRNCRRTRASRPRNSLPAIRESPRLLASLPESSPIVEISLTTSAVSRRDTFPSGRRSRGCPVQC